MTNLINNITSANSVTTLSNNKDGLQIVVRIQLHDGSWVEERFFNRVLQQIRDFSPELNSGKCYTAKIMCGKALWDSFVKYERIIAGKCIAHMAIRKFITLDFAGVTKANSRLYKPH